MRSAWSSSTRFRHHVSCALLAAATIISTAAPPALAAKVDSALRSHVFTEEDAAARLDKFLEAAKDSTAPKLVGRERWRELEASYRPTLLRAKSHEAFADGVNALITASGVSHFCYYPDSSWGYWYMGSVFGDADEFRVAHIGVFPQRIDGRWFARGVFEGSPANRAGVLVGDELVAVDGKSYQPIRSFRGKGGQAVTLRVQRHPGRFVDLEVTPVVEPLSRAMERAITKSIRVVNYKGHRFAYLHGWTLLGKTPEYGKLLELEPEVDGLLLDYRDGFGGNWGSASKFLVGDGNGKPGRSTWQKPVVILTADGTRSAKEIVVDRVRRRGRAPLVGLPTPGNVIAVGSVRRVTRDAIVELPGHRFSLEGHPTIPDFLVARTIPYCAGEDVQLDAAEAVLEAWVDADATSPLGASVHEVVSSAH